MSKEYTKEEIIQNKKDAIKALNKMLECFINDPSEKHLKKANLISYWIKDYAKMLRFEEHFDPTKNVSYKRGNIVKLNFGFNIGAEYGGLHYGVVLDNHNAHSSPVVTIIPLTSIKSTKEIHSNNVDLGNELYRSLKLKYDTISKSLKEEQEELSETDRAFDDLVEMLEESFEKYEAYEPGKEKDDELARAKKYLASARRIEKIFHEKELHNRSQQEYLDKIGLEISRMKDGSIALVSQITTISKMRIFDPRNLKGVLSGISLSEENMEKINQKLKELYVFQ